MIVGDLIKKRKDGLYLDKILKCDLIAIDRKSGHILFDTSKNKLEFIEKYYNAEIDCLWADTKQCHNNIWGDYVIPVVKCYIKKEVQNAGSEV